MSHVPGNIREKTGKPAVSRFRPGFFELLNALLVPHNACLRINEDRLQIGNIVRNRFEDLCVLSVAGCDVIPEASLAADGRELVEDLFSLPCEEVQINNSSAIAKSAPLEIGPQIICMGRPASTPQAQSIQISGDASRDAAGHRHRRCDHLKSVHSFRRSNPR